MSVYCSIASCALKHVAVRVTYTSVGSQFHSLKCWQRGDRSRSSDSRHVRVRISCSTFISALGRSLISSLASGISSTIRTTSPGRRHLEQPRAHIESQITASDMSDEIPYTEYLSLRLVSIG